MKVVINKCYGGFSLSAKAVKRLAELEGKKCYFFKHNYKANRFEPVGDEETLKNGFMVTAFSVPNPDEYLGDKEWSEMTSKEKKIHSRKYKEIDLNFRPEDRSNPNLVKVVRELGKEANGMCADLHIVNIPKDVNYTIEEYDGLEHVAEVHREWY